MQFNEMDEVAHQLRRQWGKTKAPQDRLDSQDMTAAQLQLLAETGMNRRDFLKLLGKTMGATVAAGTPLKQIAALTDKLPSLSQKFFPSKFYVYSDPVDVGQGRIPEIKPLSQILAQLWDHYQDLLEFTGSKGQVYTAQDNLSAHNNFFQTINGEDVKSILEKSKKLEYDVHDVSYSAEEPQWQVSTPTQTFTISPEDYHWNEQPVGSNPLLNYIEHYLKKFGNAQRIKIDPEGERLLKQYGYSDADVENLRQSMQQNAKEYEDRERKHQKPKFVDQGRESGYERQGMSDPQHSRLAQAVGPFESRDVTAAQRSLLSEIDDKLRKLQRAAARGGSTGDATSHLMQRYRAGDIDESRLRILAGLRYEPALLIAKQHLPEKGSRGESETPYNYDRRSNWTKGYQIEVALQEGGGEVAKSLGDHTFVYVLKHIQELPDEVLGEFNTRVKDFATRALGTPAYAALRNAINRYTGVVERARLAEIDSIWSPGDYIYHNPAVRALQFIAMATLFFEKTRKEKMDYFLIGNALNMAEKVLGLNIDDVRQQLINKLL
jgi:hypothetical protein